MEEKVIGGRYEYRKQLGKGGNASVFLCYDRKLQKEWAVKELMILQDGTDSSEQELLKTISCNLFPRIVDVVLEQEYIYLIMDYIEGISLMEKMRRQKLTEREVYRWAVEIAKAILYLHRMSPPILYMDCKPENIMLTPQGEIRMVDLGSVYICQGQKKQRISGTRFFSPAEQQKGSRDGCAPDERSDIYAFGMTLYYLLTGKKKECRRFGRLCVRDQNPAVSHGMNEVIARCTEKNPDKRYQSMEEVLYQLKHIKELGRQQWTKNLLWKVTRTLAESVCIALLLLFTAWFVKGKEALWGMGSLLAIGGFIFLCRHHGVSVYEVKKEVFCGCGKRLLGYAIVLLGVLHLMTVSVLAGERPRESTKLAVTLHDWQGRKILLREGACWEISEDILLSIPVEEVSKEGGEITVTYKNRQNGKVKEYGFEVVKRK